MIFLVLASLHGSLLAQQASHVVISEFATRGPGSCNAACEFVELYNPTGADVDIGGWKLQYRAAAGSSYSTLVTFPVGAGIRSRGYFLVTPSSWTGTPSADAMWAGSGLADNGNIRLVDASNTIVDRVGYGTGNDPERSPAPNHGEQANNNSVERKASAASTTESMGPGGSEERAGNGYDTDDNAADFFVRSNGRDPQNTSSPFEPSTDDGSGSATTPIASARAGETLDVPVVITPEKGKPPAALCLVVPPVVEWSRSEADLVLGPTLTAGVRVQGDSVFLDRVVFAADSATVTLLSQRMPVMTGTVVYTVLSRSESGVFLPLRVQPSFLVIGAPMPISQARENDTEGIPIRLNQYVTVRGIVTAAAEFGAPAYLEDETGGLAVYDFSFVDSVRIGDEVTVTGKVAQFAGLTELTDAVIDEHVPGAGNVRPLILTIADILGDGVGGMERYEGRLVRVNAVNVNTTSWTVTGSGTNYRLKDASGEMDIRIDKDVDLAGAPAPGGSFDVVGIVSQYRQNAPFLGGYQLMPRSRGDVIVSGPRIVTVPVEEDITHDGVSIRWETGSEAVSFVRYGERPDSLTAVASASGSGFAHRLRLDGLRPATIYWVQPFSIGGGDTSSAQPFPVITASANSTGRMNVYFNLSIDPGVYPPLPAAGNVSLKDKLLNRIDSARFSIDLALYSFSGQTADDIAASLLAASRRGVRIRAIFESDNANSPAVRTLRASVPVILDSFDPVNAGTGLLHDKFVVIDARDRTSDTDDWVITGSWNLTDQGTLNDAQ
ncbi:MAG: lamin tail domain-containing protein, partial [Bacteroidota bacterium]|nr:lamin tail domain-containing protein [Bacteroidota bacterium]